MSQSEIKPLLDALDFIKFTDRAIGNKYVDALKALDTDLQEAEGGPYEPGSEAEKAFMDLAVEIADALEKLEEAEEVKEVVVEVDDVLEAEEEDVNDEDEEELEDITSETDDENLDDETEVIDPAEK